MIVVADTSGLIAALDEDHPTQRRAQQVLQTAGTVVISPVVLGEVDHVARRVLGARAAIALLDDISRWARAGRVVLPAVTADVVESAQAVRARYADLALDFADAVNVVIAAEYRTNALFTVDHRDFRAVRPLTAHPAFVLLSEDL